MKSVSGKKNPGSEKDGYLLWGLIAAELFMSFSFLGYVHIDPISLTFVYIPVLIAGCILRPGRRRWSAPSLALRPCGKRLLFM